MFAAHLKQILADNALVSRTSSDSMILQEMNIMAVEVAAIPPDVTAVNIYQIGSLKGLRNSECKKTCDYLLVCKAEGMDHAILVELKKTLREDKKGMEQLRRSLPLLKYLRSVCRIHCNGETHRPTLNVRYVLIGTKNQLRIDKQHVRPGQGIEKENYKGIEVHTFLGKRIRFDLLLKGGTGK